MGQGYHSSKYDSFGFSPANGESVQNGWYGDGDELKEEDVWGGEESNGSSDDHNYFQWKEIQAHDDGAPSNSSKSRRSCLSMELQGADAPMWEKRKEHVGVGFAMLDIGGRKDKNGGGWAPGFMARKVRVPHVKGGDGTGGNRYGNGWNEHYDNGGGGVPQSAPVSVPVWPASHCGGGAGTRVEMEDNMLNDESDDGDHDIDNKDINDDGDNDVEYDSSQRRKGRLTPHEIVDREHARSQKTTFSVIEGAGRTLKGMDQRRVRNAVWSCTGFED